MTSPHKPLCQFHPNFTGMSFENCSKNLIPCRTLVAVANKRKNFKYLLLKKPQKLEVRYLA
jgi:hypothetical protein